MIVRMTFSLSIQSAAAIVGATRLATGVARQIGKAIGFDEVLRSGDVSAESASESKSTDIGAAIERLAETVMKKLTAMDWGANPPASIEVTPEGRLQVVGDHPAAAQIEAALADDPDVRGAVSGLIAAGASVPMAVDLTSAADLTKTVGQANIPKSRI